MLLFCENIKARIKPAGPLGLLCRARAGLGLRLDQKLRASSLQKARENCSSRAGLGLGPRPVAPLLDTLPELIKKANFELVNFGRQIDLKLKFYYANRVLETFFIL